MSTHRSPGHGEGQGLVEFALVIPIFLLLFFGLIDIGRLVYINNALSEAAREGARWGSVQARSNTSGGRTSIQAHTIGSLAAVPNSTATVTCQDVNGNTQASCVTNDVLVVSVSSPVTMFTPVIAQIIGPRIYTATSKVIVNQ